VPPLTIVRKAGLLGQGYRGIGLNEDFSVPLLAGIASPAIMLALGVSVTYAVALRDRVRGIGRRERNLS